MVACASAPVGPAPPSAELSYRLSLPRTGAFQAPCRRESDPFGSGSGTASSPHSRARSAAETRSAVSYPRLPGESDDDYGAFWASRTSLGLYGLFHPKAIAVPVYRAPAKGKQLAYANAADTNQPHHCTVGFREFVKQTRQFPPRVRVTLFLGPCYPLASQFIYEVHLMRSALLAILL